MTETIFTQGESNVRSYCRAFPEVFHKAQGATLYSESGRAYIDFFAGAGALNYGHNNPFIKEQILAYLDSDCIVHGLDLYTTAKRTFLESFSEAILTPRNLEYKMQFTGPTGTNAVEAALKLARKVTGRTGIFAFMGGFHGMTLGSLAATGNKSSRKGAGVPLNQDVTFMPYPHGFMNSFDTIDYMDSVLSDPNSGIDTPAAILCETVQAEGGIVVAPIEWLQRLRALCDQHEILLICDDIQVGCGRTGPFFSFERAGIVPDLITLSKSLSGYGLPLSVVLLKPELDAWQPGEHNGTFRGNQLAFVGAAAGLELWLEQRLEQVVREKERFVHTFIEDEIKPLHHEIEARGLGLIWGIDLSPCNQPGIAGRVAARCFKAGLILETAGRDDQVLKLLPTLVIEDAQLREGCDIIREALQAEVG